MADAPSDPGPARRARLTQDRSREKRQALLDAALELFRKGGRVAVTHRTVAESADVSVATVGYYFAGVDDLLHTAISETLTSWTENFTALTELEGADLDSVLSGLRRLLGDSRQELRLVAWQIYITAMNDPSLAPLVSGLVNAVEAALTAAFADAEADPEVPLLTMVALTGASMVVTSRGGTADDVVDALISSIARFVDASGPAGQALEKNIQALDPPASSRKR